MTNQTINQFLSIFYPVLLSIFTAFLGYIGAKVVKLVPSIVDFVVAKIGLTKYQKISLFGKDAWNRVEEFYRLNPIIGDTIKAKQTMFATQMKIKVPGITDEIIEDVRQAIAGEVNKDKATVIKAIEQPIQEVPITPIIKYITPDGTELQPVETTTEQVTPIQDNTVTAQ